MADLRPLSDEWAQVTVRPVLTEKETGAVEGSPEHQLDPASWTEGGQGWVLGLQPYNSPGGGDLKEMHQQTSVEEVESNTSSMQIGQSSATGAGVSECQQWPDEVKAGPSATRQTKKTFSSDGEALSQTLKQMTCYRTQTKNVHVCDQCGKGFRWRSDLARHKRTHSGRKAARRRQCQSEASPLAPIPLPLQSWKMFADSCKTSRSNTKLVTDQSTHTENLQVCAQCGKGFQSLSDLTQHQLVHSVGETAKLYQCQLEEHNSNPLELISLQKKEITFTDSCETSCSNTKQAADQITHTKNLHICEQCGKGFRWRSVLVQHEHTHFGRKATDSSETSSPKPTLSRNQSSHTKNLYTCEQCGKSFRYPSEFSRHCRRKHFGKKVVKQIQCQWEAYSPSPLTSIPAHLQAANTFASSREAFSPKLSLMTGKSTPAMKVRSCDQCGKNFRYPSELSRHYRRKHLGKKAVRQGHYQSEASPLVPIQLPRQAENVSSDTCETFSPKSSLMTDQSACTKNLHICDQCEKGFQCLSELAQHQLSHSGDKAVRQGQCQSEANPLASVPLPLQGETTSVSEESTYSPKSGQSSHTKSLHICGCSESVFQWPSSLVRHECVHFGEKAASQDQCQSEAHRPSSLVPIPLQVENILADTFEMVSGQSMLETGQSTQTRQLHSKNFSWPSELTHHQPICYKETAAKRGQLHSKTDSPSSLLPIHLQTGNAFANSCNTFSQNSQLMTDQSTCTKKVHPCDQCGKGFQWPLVLDGHQSEHSGEKGARHGQCRRETQSHSPITPIPLSPKAGNTFSNSSAAFSPNTKLLTAQSNEPNDPQICSHCRKYSPGSPELTQYHSEHFGDGVARGNPCQSKGDGPNLLMPIPTSIQMESMFTNSHKAFSQIPKLTTDQSTCFKKAHICDECEKCFLLPSHLSQHVHSHSRGKEMTRNEGQSGMCSSSVPFPKLVQTCEICSPISNLTRDQSIHTKKLCICNPCGEGFQWLSDHTQHMYTHSNEQPCSCGIRVQLEEHPKLHKGSCGGGGEEETQKHQGVCEEETLKEDILTQQHQCSSCQETEEVCKCFASLKVRKCAGMCHNGARDSTDPLPPISMCKSGVSGYPHILPLKQPCAYGYCETNSYRSVDGQPTESSTHSTEVEQAPAVMKEDKPHACPKCSKRFLCTSYLTKHLRIHQEGRPYKCAICSKCFAQRSYLAKHQRLHTVGPGYSCPDCDSVFSQVSYLHKHMKIHRWK